MIVRRDSGSERSSKLVSDIMTPWSELIMDRPEDDAHEY